MHGNASPSSQFQCIYESEASMSPESSLTLMLFIFFKFWYIRCHKIREIEMINEIGLNECWIRVVISWENEQNAKEFVFGRPMNRFKISCLKYLNYHGCKLVWNVHRGSWKITALILKLVFISNLSFPDKDISITKNTVQNSANLTIPSINCIAVKQGQTGWAGCNI